MRRLDEERTRLLKELVVAEKRGEERETGKPTIPTFSIVEMSVGLTTLSLCVCQCVSLTLLTIHYSFYPTPPPFFHPLSPYLSVSPPHPTHSHPVSVFISVFR